jgi:alginate O-acetyltransferase complex protein AlgI
MLFNSFAYMIFLPVVVLLYWSCPRQWRTLLLLSASYVFYMFWKPIFGLLILGMTVANYFVGLWLDKNKTHRKAILMAGIAFNLIVLGFFKYAYFSRDSANCFLKLFGSQALPQFPFDIILPLGISFFAFEFIHYIVDVYKGSPAIKGFGDFALFPSFFPTQIAGPIKRFQDFIPQLHKHTPFKMEYLNEGAELVLFGLFKKICLADNIAIVVNRCYAHPELLSATDMWLVAWTFVFQIYFDFSGYTDVARGSALMMGFKVPVNFDLPLTSPSVVELWRRWHISLSSWLRDYLYIPLGGSRGDGLLTLRNLMITMVLCGLWHGASLNFLVWGFYLGLTLVFHRLWRKLVERFSWLQKIVATKPFHLFAIACTFNSFALGLVFFRTGNMQTAWLVIRKLFCLDAAGNLASTLAPGILGTSGSAAFQLLPLLLAGFMTAQMISSRFRQTPGIMPIPASLPALKGAYLAVLVIALLLAAPAVTGQYIYFQF